MTPTLTTIWTRSNIHTANAQQQTTPEWAQAMARIYMEDAADAHNANLVADYQAQWRRYAGDRDNQPAASNLPLPYPATAQVVDVMANGWPETVDGTTLVCMPNVYQAPKITPNTNGFGLLTQQVPDAIISPFVGVALFSTVDYRGMKFLRVA